MHSLTSLPRNKNLANFIFGGFFIMADLAPSESVTKIGSLALVFLIALLAIWAANQFATLTKLVSKKAAK
jgi:hypothetical protein